MRSEMQENARFITVDPSKQAERRHQTKGLKCQTCFNMFETHKDLRDHIAEYQASNDLELQTLTARLLEVQAHLPRKNNPFKNGDQRSEDNETNWTASDLDTEDECYAHVDNIEACHDSKDKGRANSREQNGQNSDHSTARCHHPKCIHEKGFPKRAELERHFESRMESNRFNDY
ncbi:hypothetical protein N7478_001404 [Penicillium angulare]|uniref:uncharacterized protein n=1 Tax=Penicillium angulare TaxID=116970 RepID=UPI002541EFFF|nr:uncharacterized protein N7478_001404 [Penicillium angulare]KAJ5292153.1 hypothetical protein N7478_001404 [Penicillium angulare]